MSKPDHSSSVKCADIGELLPFYLNRSLESDEAVRVKRHLATCARCRREERDTRTAWALYDGHLPVELVLDVAFDAPMSDARRRIVESHLAVCERCAQEVALASQGDASEPSADAVEPLAVSSAPMAPSPSGDGDWAPVMSQPSPATRSSPDRRLRLLAWAASLVAVVASYGWFSTWQQLVEARRTSDVTARANVAVVELIPAVDKILQRGGPDPEVAVNPVPMNDEEELVLVLLGAEGCAAGCRVELHVAERDRPEWRLDGLQLSPDGLLTVALPMSRLPDGRSVLAVRDQNSAELIGEYLIDR